MQNIDITPIIEATIAKDCDYKSVSFPSNCTINYYD